MKPWVIFLVLTISIIGNVIISHIKFKHPTDFEKINAGLNGIHTKIDPKSRILIKCDYGPFDKNGSMAVFILSPAAGNIWNGHDTTLYIIPSSVPDNDNRRLAISKQIILWSNTSDSIDYILTKKP